MKNLSEVADLWKQPYKNIILTGGPCDGQRITVSVATKEYYAPFIEPLYSDPPENLEFKSVVYRPTVFGVNGMEIWEVDIPETSAPTITIPIINHCHWEYKKEGCWPWDGNDDIKNLKLVCPEGFVSTFDTCDGSYEDCQYHNNQERFGGFAHLPPVPPVYTGNPATVVQSILAESLTAEIDKEFFNEMVGHGDEDVLFGEPTGILQYGSTTGNVTTQHNNSLFTSVGANWSAKYYNQDPDNLPVCVECPKHGRRLGVIVEYSKNSIAYMCSCCFYLEEVKYTNGPDNPRNFRHIILGEE